MNLIRLSATQRRVKKFEHPVFKGAVTYTKEDLNALVEERLSGGPDEPLILALRSTVRYLIGRYLWSWPSSRRFLDEMVGDGMMAITMLVNGLTREILMGTHIQKLTSSRVRTRIEEGLNELQSLSAPCTRVQRRLIEGGEPPSYLVSEREPEHEDKSDPDSDLDRYEMMEALGHLRAECSMASQILDPDNWGLTDQELADKLGTHRITILRRRRRLLSQYHILIGEDV